MINWSDIDTVLLDMDGTLLDLHFDNHFWLHHLPKRYAETHNIDEAVANQTLSAHIERERGTLNWYCLDYWTEALNINIVDLKREVMHLIQIRPHVELFLRQLQEQGKQVWLLTNAHPDSVDLKMEKTQLDTLLNKIISSHEFDLPKESAVFWKRLCSREQFDPERTLFIDDTEVVLDAAQQFGIKHLLCIRQPDSKKELRGKLDFPAIHHFDEILPNPNALNSKPEE